MTAAVLMRKVARIADKLQQLAALRRSDLSAFLHDRAVRDLSAFYLALAIEDCIDIAEHFIAERGWEAPDSAADAFACLARHGLISAALEQKMAEAAGMRNALLHEYEDLDWARVHAATLDLTRIEEFVASVGTST